MPARSAAGSRSWRSGSAIRLPVYARLHQGRPDRRLHRVLRRSRPREARPGLGHDLPADQIARPAPVGGFAAEFHAAGRAPEQPAVRSAAGRAQPATRRALIAGFPAQVASLEAPLREFLQEAFGGSRLDPAPMLRGFYFTSGTQEGTPIDRLTGVLARSFGVDQRRAPSLRPEQGRSYFLARLLKEVIFGEAMLVSQRPGRGAPPAAAARRRVRRGRRSWCSLGTGAAVARAQREPGADRRDGGGARRLRPDRRGLAARSGRRCRPAAHPAAARPGARAAARLRSRQRGRRCLARCSACRRTPSSLPARAPSTATRSNGCCCRG